MGWGGLSGERASNPPQFRSDRWRRRTIFVLPICCRRCAAGRSCGGGDWRRGRGQRRCDDAERSEGAGEAATGRGFRRFRGRISRVRRAFWTLDRRVSQIRVRRVSRAALYFQSGSGSFGDFLFSPPRGVPLNVPGVQRHLGLGARAETSNFSIVKDLFEATLCAQEIAPERGSGASPLEQMRKKSTSVVTEGVARAGGERRRWTTSVKPGKWNDIMSALIQAQGKTDGVEEE